LVEKRRYFVDNKTMAKILIFIIALFLALGFCPRALAHQPQIVGAATDVAVNQPEISKAYYGKLAGKPAIYTIEADKPFYLYIQLLAPQNGSAKAEFSARIFKNRQLLSALDGKDHLWLAMYEPFGNDYYNQGPEYEANVPAGVYSIEVFNAGNKGIYALAVGKTESLAFGGMIKTLAALPALKADYFGESAWTAYNNFTGLFALIIVISFVIAAYILIRLAFIRRLKNKLDHEYQKFRQERGGDRG
jgi:hypothetical protein